MPLITLALVVTTLPKIIEYVKSEEFKKLVDGTTKLYISVQQHQENEGTWTVLANRSLHIVQSLADTRCDSPAFDAQVKSITEFHQNVYTYHQNKIAKLSKVELVFKSGEIRRKINEFSKELDVLWHNVMLTLSIVVVNKLDDAAVREAACEAVRRDEARDQALLDSISSMIRSNNDTVLEKLDIRLSQQEWKIRQATDALQRMLNDIDIEKAVANAIMPLLKMIQNRSKVSQSMTKEDWRIDPLHVDDRSADAIGSGGFGKVYTASYFGAPVAIKELYCTVGEHEMAEFRREIGIWHKLKHPHVLPLLGACDTAEKPFMVSPFMRNGTLSSYIYGREHPVQEKLRIMYEVASGMAYLHGNNIVHGDIKSLNVLLDDHHHAVISDFGLSRAKHTSATHKPAQKNDRSGGTLLYMAPEMLDLDEPCGSSKRTDVYAYGIMFYEVMINGGYIWVTADGKVMSEKIMEHQVTNGRRPKRRPHISDDVWSLIEDCWHHDPRQRPSFNDILSRIQKVSSAEFPHASLSALPNQDSTKTLVDCMERLSISNPPNNPPNRSSSSSSVGSKKSTIQSPSIDLNSLSLSQQVSMMCKIPEAIQLGIDHGDPEECKEAIKILSKEKPASDTCWEMVYRLYKKMAENKNLEACFELAWLYFAGIGVEKSDIEAFAYWKRVMGKSDDAVHKTISMYMVGVCHYLGVGTERDLATGWKLIKESKSDEFVLGGIWAFDCDWGTSIDKIQSSSRVSKVFLEHVKFGSENNNLLKHLEAVCYMYGFGTDKDQMLAVGIFTSLANGGFAASQVMLGSCFFDGYVVEKSHENAVEWFKCAAEQGYGWGQACLGDCYRNGYGVVTNHDFAAICYRKSADQGDAHSQCCLGVCYLHGQGVAQEYGKAVELFRKSADQGDAGAQNWLGICYREGKGVPQDHAKAVEWCWKAAEQGHRVAQCNLGNCYHHGRGVPQSDADAYKWWSMAADQGYVNAQFNLGYCYYYGRGVPKDRTKASEWCQKAADQGHADAQCWLGVFYYYGRGVAKDYAKAFQLWQKAGDEGHAGAQYYLKYCYRDDTIVPQEHAKTADWWLKASKSGDFISCFELAWLYFAGIGVEKSDIEAFAYWKRVMGKSDDAVHKTISTYMVGVCHYLGVGTERDLATGWKLIKESKSDEFVLGGIWAFDCDWGTSIDKIQSSSRVSKVFLEHVKFGSENNNLLKHLEAVCYFYGFGTSKDQKKAVQMFTSLAGCGLAASQVMLGSCFFDGYVVEKSHEKATEWLKRAAEQGYMRGQANLAWCYYHGQGVAQDHAKAFEWYQKAADQGHAYAQCGLGFCYLFGQGVAQDYEKAVDLFRKSADQGDAGAQNWLGSCYREGKGVPQDHAKAVEWCWKAAEQGHRVAQCNLGNCYHHGFGVPQSDADAYKWWSMAADQGYVNAQFNLGYCYYYGRGVPEDRAKAAEWFQKAADQGDSDAKKRLQKMSKDRFFPLVFGPKDFDFY